MKKIVQPILCLFIATYMLSCNLNVSKKLNTERMLKDMNLFMDSTKFDIEIASIELTNNKTNIEFTLKNNNSDIDCFSDSQMINNLSEFLFYKFVAESYILPLKTATFIFEGNIATKIEFTDIDCYGIIDKYSNSLYYNSVEYIFLKLRFLHLYEYELKIEYIDIYLEVPPEDDFFVTLFKIAQYKNRKSNPSDIDDLATLRMILLFDFYKSSNESQKSFDIEQILKCSGVNVDYSLREEYASLFMSMSDSLKLSERFNKDSVLVNKKKEIIEANF